MTNLEINQLLHERVMGRCWHEWERRNHIFSDCVKCCIGVGCGIMYKYENPSYTSSWADYGRLLEVAMTKEWWFEFLNTIVIDWVHQYEVLTIVINPLRGSTAMAEFVKERGI